MLDFLKKRFPVKSRAPRDINPAMTSYNATRDTQKLSSFCYAPSVNMYFSQDGHVKLCCHNAEYSMGKYPDQTISQIWNSEAAKKIRQDMQEYRLYGGCNICKADVDMGAFYEVRARHFDSLPVHPQYPTMMEFLLTNTCNLECIMCKGEFSSLIRQNREKLPPMPNAYDDRFIEQLREFIPHLREARFSGSGEAFLIDANYKIWEMILELNPDCLIMVQTNGMVLNGRIKELLNRGRFQIGVSLDSLKKEVFETIRPNARLERVKENILYFNEYARAKKIKFCVALCVMRQNWRELAEFAQYANSLNATVTFHKVYHPVGYSMQTLSKKELQEAILHLSAVSLPTETYLQRQNARHYQYIIDSLKEWESEASTIVAEDLTRDELVTAILDKAMAYLREECMEEAIAEHQAFQLKLGRLLEMFASEGKERKVLMQMYLSDFKLTYPYLKQHSESDLYSLSAQLAPDVQ